MIILNKDYNFLDENRTLDEFPPAMVYIPTQRLCEMYPPETALCKGTLFPELDLPFAGRTVMGGCKNV